MLDLPFRAHAAPSLSHTLAAVCRVLPLPDQPPPTAFRVRQLERDRITTVPLPVCISPHVGRTWMKVGVAEPGFTVWRRGDSTYVLPRGEVPAT